MTKKKTLVAGLVLAIVIFVTAVPVNAAGTTTLSALAVTVSKISAKVRRLASDGTLKAAFVKYDNTKSGLKAKTAQDAIDELGTSLKNLVAGTDKARARASSLHATSTTEPTTWKGYAYIYSTNPFGTNAPVKKTQQITVTFTPTTTTTGTFTVSPLYLFGIAGGHLAFDLSGTPNYSPTTPLTVCGREPITGYGYNNLPTGTYGGKYQIVGDEKMWTFPTSATNSPCLAPPVGFFGAYSHKSEVSVKGETMTIDNDDDSQVILVRQ